MKGNADNPGPIERPRIVREKRITEILIPR